MAHDFVGVQRMDGDVRHDPIILPDRPRREISRVREFGHAAYRPTRGFRRAGTDGETEESS